MAVEIVRIDNLHLRVLGLGPDEGRILGQELSRRLSDGFPSDMTPKHLGCLALRIPTSGDGTSGGLSKVVADAILGKIG